MRIAVFSDSYLPYVSGVVRSIQILRSEAIRRGHQVFLFAPDYPGCQKGEEGIFRFYSFPAPGNGSFRLAVPFSTQILRTLQKLRVELIHVHSPFLLGELGAYAAFRLNLPLVFTHHTLYDEYVHYAPLPHHISQWVTVNWVTRFANRCSTVIAPTQWVADRIRRQGVKVPVAVIPTGVDVERFRSGNREEFRRRYGIGPGEKLLLFVGRLTPEKNLVFLLDVFHWVAEAEPGVKLALVADGPDRRRLEILAGEMGLGGRIIFTGVLPAGVVPDAYAGADVFVFPSLTETQGLVVAEAQAAGLPVVALAAGGVPDMLTPGQDSFLVSPEDKQGFQEAVLRLLRNDGLRREMGSKARENAQRLTTGNCVQRVLSLYQSLISSEEDTFSIPG